MVAISLGTQFQEQGVIVVRCVGEYVEKTMDAVGNVQEHVAWDLLVYWDRVNVSLIVRQRIAALTMDVALVENVRPETVLQEKLVCRDLVSVSPNVQENPVGRRMAAVECALREHASAGEDVF